MPARVWTRSNLSTATTSTPTTPNIQKTTTLVLPRTLHAAYIGGRIVTRGLRAPLPVSLMPAQLADAYTLGMRERGRRYRSSDADILAVPAERLHRELAEPRR